MIKGKIAVSQKDVSRAHMNRILSDTALDWSSREVSENISLYALEIKRAAITSCFIPIDLEKSEMYLDQTYAEVQAYFRMIPVITNDDFELNVPMGEFKVGKYVLIGGSSDMNWFHWILNWTPRITLVALLFPELIGDKNVKFLFHSAVNTDAFKSWARALGIDDVQMEFIDPDETSFYENLIVPAFPFQKVYFQKLLQEHRTQIYKSLKYEDDIESPARIWISRQNLNGEKRRIANFDEIMPVLNEFGIEPVVLDGMPFDKLLRMFAKAEFVVGTHGAGLCNLILCAPRTKVLIIENERNIWLKLSGLFATLATVAQLDTQMLSADEEILPDSDYSQWGILHNRNFLMDADKLRAALNLCFSQLAIGN